MRNMTDKYQKTIWLTTLILVGMSFFGGCKKSDIYRPYYYPDKNDLTKYIKGPDFSSLEEAREWVHELNKQRGDRQWDYEIGKNPRPSKYGDVEICEDTLR
jgi:hypothetical protein